MIPAMLMELEADLFPVKHEALFPTCRRSLIEKVRAHLREFHAVPANVAAEAQRQRERARILVKGGRQLYALIGVKLREAEAKQAELEARRRRLASDPCSAAMAMTSHLTESVYRRCAIVDEAMLREAGDKLARLQELAAPPKGAAARLSPPSPHAGLQ